MSTTFAVDRNTIAFYVTYEYDDEGNKIGVDTYDVAVGWQNMSTIDEDVNVQVYPVLEKTNDGVYQATDLAEVIIFEYELRAVSDDYMLVLDRNAWTSDDELWLNVVLEDGTVAEVQIDDNYASNGAEFEDDGDFMKAYPYVENADGTYDIVRGTVYGQGAAELYRTGTVAFAEGDDDDNDELDDPVEYIAYDPDDTNIWDVTGVDSANDEVVAGDFDRNVVVNAVIVGTDEDTTEIRTAWIWDISESATPDDEPVDGLIVRTIANNVRNTSAETFSSIRTAVSNRVELSMSEAQANAAKLELQFAEEVDSARYAIYNNSDSDISANDYADAELIDIPANYNGEDVTVFPVDGDVQDLDDGNVIVIFLEVDGDIYYAAYEIVVD